MRCRAPITDPCSLAQLSRTLLPSCPSALLHPPHQFIPSTALPLPWPFLFLQVVNLGEFPFAFKLTNLASAGAPPKTPRAGSATPPPPSSGKETKAASAAAAIASSTTTKTKTKAGDKPAAATDKGAQKAGGAGLATVGSKSMAPSGGLGGGDKGTLALGPFVIEPAEGVIQPGGRREVEVVFKAEGSQVGVRGQGIALGAHAPLSLCRQLPSGCCKTLLDLEAPASCPWRRLLLTGCLTPPH